MSDFLDIEKAEKLRDVLRNATHPLAERKTKKSKHGLSGYTVVDPAIEQTFAVLIKNGYGSSQISDKTAGGEEKLNEFSRLVNVGKKEPKSVIETLSGYDTLKLSQIFYVYNGRAKRDDRYMIDIVESKCLLGILERAMELGQHRRPG